MLNWRIYYADGSTFCNEDGDWADAPAWGVIAVTCAEDRARGVDFTGLIDYLCRTGLVKFGRLVDNDTYHRVLRQAQNDPDFPSDRCVFEGGDFYYLDDK